MSAQTNSLINSGELLNQASVLYDSGSYRQAISLYQQIDRNDTNYYQALYNLALTYAADSQFNESIRYCRKALAPGGNPEKYPDIYNQLGNSMDAAGDHEGALKLFDSALQKWPSYSYLYINKGTTLLKLERYKEAEAVFEKAIMNNPFSASSHFKLAIVNIYQGKLIQGFLGIVSYLMMDPRGRYNQNCITMLSAIAHNKDEIQQYINKRKETPSDNYLLLEQILQSKIALNKDYKVLVKLDDAIFRQIQVMFEKMEYDPADPDFTMQYYVPYFKSVFTKGQLEIFLFHCFRNVNIPIIQDYVKNNKKELNAFTDQATEFFRTIRVTGELNYARRSAINTTNYTGRLYYSDNSMGKGMYQDNGTKKSGPWEFFYPAGCIQAKGGYNDQGQKDGIWDFFYFDGTLKAREIYRNGNQEGEGLYYYASGDMSSRSQYANNKADGESIAYFQIGTVRSVTHYKAGKEEGEKISYFRNGRPSYEEHFKAGNHVGQIKSWYDNGQLEYVTTYVNDKVDGPYKKYYQSGQLMEDGQYQKDKQEGAWKYYHPNGQLKSETMYVDGKQEGLFQEFYDNGKIAATYTSKKGKTQGEARYNDRDGKLFSILNFENDLIKTGTYFDKAGKQTGKSEQSGGVLNLTVYRPDGSKRLLTTYDDKGNIKGTRTYYFPSGALQETAEYKDGDEDGPDIDYFTNGRKRAITNYSQGKKDGHHQLFYPYGTIEEDGWYVQDQMAGYWMSYNELGVVTDSTYYSENSKNGYKVEYTPSGKKEFETRYRIGWLEELTQFDSTGRELAHVVFKNGAAKYELVYPDGKPFIRTEYKGGMMQGPRNVYYFDGKPMLTEYYVHGAQDSIYRYYAHTGRLTQEGIWHLGDKTGVWKSYWENGNLSRSEEYKNGKTTGVRYDYTEEGKKEIETEFKEGNKHGAYRRFDPDGTLLYQLNYEEDVLVSYTYLDKNGQLLPAIPLPLQTGRIKTYFPNGNLSADMEYRDGVQTGIDNLYYTNGKPRATSGMEDGNTEGVYSTYWPSGQKKADYGYLHDNPHGPYKTYNDKGILTEEGNYYNGSQHGLVKRYDEQGKLKETSVYYYGRLLSIK